MDTTPAVDGLRCAACGATAALETGGRCAGCGGPVSVVYDDPAVDRDSLAADWRTGLAGLGALLPFPADTLVDLGAGGTPLLARPSLAADLGVASLAVKDEGRNPTGAMADRGAALGVTAAAELGAETVALPSMGNAAQAVAAHAAAAGLDSESFVPTRTPFVNKAMINVHGGEMTVVPGRWREAEAAYEDAAADESWHPLGPGDTPYRHEGAKTVALELLAQREWAVPDVVVVPTGHGLDLAGLHKGFREAVAVGLVDSVPRLVAAQASGCAPIVDAWNADAAAVDPVETPDTICGPLEIPNPAGGALALEALSATDGAAVAVPDDALLAAAVEAAETGLSASVSGGAALAAARDLASTGWLDAEADVVLVDPLAGSKEADLLRSHLMGQGR